MFEYFKHLRYITKSFVPHPQKTGFTGMDKEKFKNEVSTVARKQQWRMEQIQLAEDYIDDLYATHGAAQKPPKLFLDYAGMIRKAFDAHN